MWIITTQMVIQLNKNLNKHCHSKNHFGSGVLKWVHTSSQDPVVKLSGIFEQIIIYNDLWNLNHVSLQQNKLYQK